MQSFLCEEAQESCNVIENHGKSFVLKESYEHQNPQYQGAHTNKGKYFDNVEGCSSRLCQVVDDPVGVLGCLNSLIYLLSGKHNSQLKEVNLISNYDKYLLLGFDRASNIKMYPMV